MTSGTAERAQDPTRCPCTRSSNADGLAEARHLPSTDRGCRQRLRVAVSEAAPGVRRLRCFARGGIGCTATSQATAHLQTRSAATTAHNTQVRLLEASFAHLTQGQDTQSKIREASFCGKQAADDGMRYFCVDICCID